MVDHVSLRFGITGRSPQRVAPRTASQRFAGRLLKQEPTIDSVRFGAKRPNWPVRLGAALLLGGSAYLINPVGQYQGWQMAQYRLIMETGTAEEKKIAVQQLHTYLSGNRFEVYRLAMQSGEPQLMRQVAWQLDSLPEQERFKAYQLALQSNDPKVLTYAAWKLYSLPKADIPAAIDLTMGTGNEKAQIEAAQRFGLLAIENNQPRTDELIQKAISQAIATQKPKVISAITGLGFLSPEAQQKQVETLLALGSPEAIGAVANHLAVLYRPEDRTKTFNMAIASNDEGTQVIAADNLEHLRGVSETACFDAYLKALNTGKKAVQLAAVSRFVIRNVHGIFGSRSLDAFKAAWETNDLDIQNLLADSLSLFNTPEEKVNAATAWGVVWAAENISLKSLAIKHLYVLPKEQSWPKFQEIVNTQNLHLIEEAATTILYLPRENRLDAFRLIIDRGNKKAHWEAVTTQFEYLPNDAILPAFRAVLEKSDASVISELFTKRFKSLIQETPKEQRVAVFNSILDTLESRKMSSQEIADAIAATITHLPLEAKDAAWERWKALPKPEQ